MALQGLIVWQGEKEIHVNKLSGSLKGRDEGLRRSGQWEFRMGERSGLERAGCWQVL